VRFAPKGYAVHCRGRGVLGIEQFDV